MIGEDAAGLYRVCSASGGPPPCVRRSDRIEGAALGSNWPFEGAVTRYHRVLGYFQYEDSTMTATTPVKVSAETDQLLTEASHYLARSKKDIVDAAVLAYVEANRAEINAGVRASLARLDGSLASVVSELTGMSREQLDELGGVPDQ